MQQNLHSQTIKKASASKFENPPRSDGQLKCAVVRRKVYVTVVIHTIPYGYTCDMLSTVDFRALEIEIPGKSTCRFLNDLVEFRNRAAKVPIDFYWPISKTPCMTVPDIVHPAKCQIGI